MNTPKGIKASYVIGSFLPVLLCLIWLPCRASADTQLDILCPYVTASLVVDGSAGDWASVKSRNVGISFYKGDGHAGSSSNLGTTICRTISNEADCRVDLWLAHDNTYLYVLAEVRDDDHEAFGSPGSEDYMAYLEDTLHLYIDSTNARRSNIPNPPINTQYGYEQFGISTDGNIYGENTDFTNSSVTPAPKGAAPDGDYWKTQCQVQAILGGYLYTFEERIALAGKPGGNMAAMAPGGSYGFDAEFCDADYGVQLQGFLWWSSNGYTDAWNHENLWGTMTLETVPEPSAGVLLIFAAMIVAAARSRNS